MSQECKSSVKFVSRNDNIMVLGCRFTVGVGSGFGWGRWFPVFGSWFSESLGEWFPVPGSRFLVPGFQ
ncbi:MAG: hypothetical protein AMS27_10385 [Bacteroides sp. SM23_62_1]|nr:MAG: hypothetical protein AMS27_10385 [Bacteroides sp. SM23_62_1]